MWKFEVYEDTGGEPRWRLKASNGARVAASGESFDSNGNADRAAKGFKANAKTASYTIFQGSGTVAWYWNAKAANGAKSAIGGESFVSKQSAQAAADTYGITRVEPRIRDAAGLRNGTRVPGG